jgi:hypothetical protein
LVGLLNANSTHAYVGALASYVTDIIRAICTIRHTLIKATEHPCLNLADSRARPVDFEENILREGQRSNRKKMNGPEAIANTHIHIRTSTDSQMTYPLNVTK